MLGAQILGMQVLGFGAASQDIQCLPCPGRWNGAGGRWGLLVHGELQSEGGGPCKGRCFTADLHPIISANGGLPVADYTGGYLLAKHCTVLIFPFCLFRL